jgi:hypothetical protein
LKTPGDLIVIERFQTFTTRLRPHRIAILIDIADKEWQNTCMAVIEFLSQIWGGYYSLIVPTDGNTISDSFWAMLSSFDPDLILGYRKTGSDLARNKPEEFERILAAHIQSGVSQGDSYDGLEPMIRKSLMDSSLDTFSISPELTRQLLIRLSPFHFQNELQIKWIHSGASPQYPHTAVADIVKFVSAPDVILEIRNNLPTERQGPPALWLAAELGIATPDYQAALQSKKVTCVPKIMDSDSDSEIIRWATLPGYAPVLNSPFSFTRLALATVRAVAALRYAIPSVIVQGDTVSDFCLYYGLSRLHGRAIWAPSWFDPIPDSYPARLMTAISNLHDMGRWERSEEISVISASIPPVVLQESVATARKYTTMSSFAVEDANSGAFIQKIVEYPSKVYVKKNIDQITTHQIVEERMPGFFESPVPVALSHVNPQIHRWLVEISFMNLQMPRHPALGSHLASGPNLTDVRAGLDGVAFQCPGFMVRGEDIELQMLRLSVFVPGPEKVFRIALAHCGYNCEVSDKGKYESETVSKFGGLEGAAHAVRHSQTSQLLKEFLNTQRPVDGVYDDGVFLGDKRRYLNFACILKFLRDEAFACRIIDDYIAKGVFYRGLVLKCNRCSDLAWFSIAEITQNFTCRRCGAYQQYTHPSWRYPNEPAWFYKLDEMVYQMLRNNGDVTLLTLDALSRNSKGNFQFASELSIKPEGNIKSTMEIDIPCIMNGKMIVGEAKSVNTLTTNGSTAAQAAAKYRCLAEQLGADGVIFSTSMSDWDQTTHKAIDAEFARYPHLKVYKYTAAQL